MKFVDNIKKKVSNFIIEDYLKAWFSGDDVPNLSQGVQHIDSETAMKFTAVFSCVRVLSETLAATPILEYRKVDEDKRLQTRDTAAYEILHNVPNEEMSPFNFKETSMIALNLGGNAVSQKLVNSLGDTVGLYPYEWSRVNIDRDTNTRKLIYKISDGSKEIILDRSQVFHIPGLSLNGVTGLSPISYTAKAIQLGLSYEQFGINFYKNGAHSSGVFSFPGHLEEDSFQRLKKDLKKNYTGLLNTGTPMLLEEGGQFSQMTINPADAQLIENKRFQIEDICRIYRVPQHLVQLLEHSTNNNIEHQSLEFIMYTMLPWFKRWEEAINMQLLTLEERKAGYYLEFKIDTLLRGDAKSRAEAYATGRNWGWLSVNDIRKLENLPPIPNGNIYLQPSNMIEAGKEATQNSNTKALAEEIYRMITERR